MRCHTDIADTQQLSACLRLKRIIVFFYAFLYLRISCQPVVYPWNLIKIYCGLHAHIDKNIFQFVLYFDETV